MLDPDREPNFEYGSDSLCTKNASFLEKSSMNLLKVPFYFNQDLKKALNPDPYSFKKAGSGSVLILLARSGSGKKLLRTRNPEKKTIQPNQPDNAAVIYAMLQL